MNDILKTINDKNFFSEIIGRWTENEKLFEPYVREIAIHLIRVLKKKPELKEKIVQIALRSEDFRKKLAKIFINSL